MKWLLVLALAACGDNVGPQGSFEIVGHSDLGARGMNSALAIYQVVLMSIGYGRVRLPFLARSVASLTHRAIGGTIAAVTIVVALMCLSYFGLEEDEATLHAVSGFVLLGVLAFKVAVIRWWHGLARFLPALGITVLLLFAFTWVTSAGDFLANGPQE